MSIEKLYESNFAIDSPEEIWKSIKSIKFFKDNCTMEFYLNGGLNLHGLGDLTIIVYV